MNIEIIDLYENFKLERKKGYKGYLKCFIKDEARHYDQSYIYPAMLILPGGGYCFVSPREGDPIALQYSACGFQTFVLDYTVATVQHYPVQLQEAAMAMVFIRENAEHFNLSKDMVCAAGFSAGGHLCACLANLFDDPTITGIFPECSHLIRPDAVILSYPVITSQKKTHGGSFDALCGDDRNLKNHLSLEHRVKRNTSPAFIWHTYNDGIVPVYNSLAYALACEKNDVPFALHIFEKGNHGLATAREDTNSQEAMMKSSTGVDKWLSLSVDWLKDRNIRLK